MNASTVAFVFARGGSKGIPDKNRQAIGGSTLIGRAVHHARSAGTVDLVAVSSDDRVLLDLAREAGADITIERPPELAADDSPEWLSWRHALGQLEAEEGIAPRTFLSVPCTAPLRRPSDLDACATRLLEGDVDVVVTGTPSRRHPAFNMVTIGPDSLVRRAMTLEGQIFRRQDAPPMYDLTTVCYAARPDFVLTASGIFDGRVGLVEVPEDRALDIDTPFDLHLARLLVDHPFPRSTT